MNRKFRLKEVQDLFGVKVEPVLKYSSTQWLSLGQALLRLHRHGMSSVNFSKKSFQLVSHRTKVSFQATYATLFNTLGH